MISRHNNRYSNTQDDKPKKKQVKLALKAISEMKLQKIKNINRNITSYGLKHRLEDYLRKIIRHDEDCYISEGACIKAMVKIGFDTYVDKYNRTYFNVSQREITTVINKVRAIKHEYCMEINRC